MSEVKVNKISPRSGTALTVGDSGDTVTVAGNDVRSDAYKASDGGNLVSQSGTTITLGASGDTVTIASGATLVGGGIDWQSSVKTATFTAVSGEGYFINTSGGAFEADLPTSPSVGDEIEFVDFSRSFATNNFTIDQGSNNFQGFTSSTAKPSYAVSGQTIKIVYSGSTKGWIPTSDDDVANKQPITVDFLVIAGGGGGGNNGGSGGNRGGGGGGAGGYRNSYNSETSGGGGSSESSLNLTAGEVYTVTIGAGGSGNADGSDSSVSGSGITTITSTGGGRGGVGDSHGGNNGGSGGGRPHNGGAGSGTANQGFDGGSPAVDTGTLFIGTGGGGAGSVGGGSSAPSSAGAGGSGLSSSIIMDRDWETPSKP